MVLKYIFIGSCLFFRKFLFVSECLILGIPECSFIRATCQTDGLTDLHITHDTHRHACMHTHTHTDTHTDTLACIHTFSCTPIQTHSLQPHHTARFESHNLQDLTQALISSQFLSLHGLFSLCYFKV